MPQSDSFFSPNPIADLLEVAESYSRVCDWQAAEPRFRSAVSQDPTPASRIAFGCALAEQERFHEALCEFTLALDVATATGDKTALETIYHNFACLYRQLGDADLAQRFQQRSLSQSFDCGPEELMAFANDAWLSNREELAESLAEAAVSLQADGPDDADVNDDRDESRCLTEVNATQSLMHGLRSNVSEGIVGLWRCYLQHRAAGAWKLMGHDLLNLSLLLGNAGRSKGEWICVNRAIHCYEVAGAPVSAHKARQTRKLLERMRAVRNFEASRN